MTHGFSPAFLYFLSLLAARTAIIFVAVVVGLRLMGKRQIGVMNVYDLALIMALANGVQNAMTAGKGDLSVGLVCAGTLLLIGRLLVSVFLRLPRLEQAVCGSPTVLVNDGQVLAARMRREGVTEEQLLAALRRHGLTTPKQARLAVLEVDGTLSIVPVVGEEAEGEEKEDTIHTSGLAPPD